MHHHGLQPKPVNLHKDQNHLLCQHEPYFESHGDFTCSRKAFLSDFELKLQWWQSTEEKLIVFIDTNEDSLKGNIDAMLDLDGLEMTEVVCSTHPELPVPPTFQCSDHCGCHTVDGCYATPNLQVLKAVWLAIFKCPGDHRIPIVDFKYKDMLGEHILKIIHPQA